MCVCVGLSSENGVLSLYNITAETSGFFICTSTNEIKSATCNLTLAVMPRKKSSFSLILIYSHHDHLNQLFSVRLHLLLQRP